MATQLVDRYEKMSKILRFIQFILDNNGTIMGL